MILDEVPVSVCIPAHNEENTIGATIESILTQRGVCIDEVIVCANGCTDGTARVVTTLAQRDPRVRLLTLGSRGKPGAWNALMDAAINDHVLFGDGDVIFGPDTTRRLLKTLHGAPALIVAAGTTVPALPGDSRRHRWTIPPRDMNGSIPGRCYLARKSSMKSRLGERGYPEMPRQIINEDSWLTLALGRGRWTLVPEATVAYCYPRYRDLLAIEKRSLRGKRQFRAYFADLLATEGETTRERYARWNRQLQEIPGYTARLRMVANALVRRLFRLTAMLLLRRERVKDAISGWEVAYSSKAVAVAPETRPSIRVT